MPTFIPPQGFPPTFFGRDPQLLPNFDMPVVGGDSAVGRQNPWTFLTNNPRVDATVTATAGGSITNGDTITITFTLPTLPNGGIEIDAIPVVTADTTTTIAEKIANAINNDQTLASRNITAQMGGTSAATNVVIHAGGPIGNFVTVSASVSGSATETVTFTNSGVASGGSGPVFAANNFQTMYANGGTGNFVFGQPYLLGYDVLVSLVNQGLPIV